MNPYWAHFADANPYYRGFIPQSRGFTEFLRQEPVAKAMGVVRNGFGR